MSAKPAILGGTPVRTAPYAKWPVFDQADEQRLVAVLHSGRWGRTAGDQVTAFERRFADYLSARHAIAVVNGTVALRIALLAIGLHAGDEVIVPPYTFLATASAVVEANGTPVFADIDPETLNIDPKAVERAITPRTRAIIPVHLGGLAADMDAIVAIAKKHGLHVIEDTAHAHGAEYKGRKLGTIGHIGSFSFQSSKNMTSGEGGILVSNDQELADRCFSLHNCGRLPRGGAWYDHHVIGGNYRLSEFQGAILHGQLDRLEDQARTRDQNGLYLSGRLAEIPGVKPQKRGPEHIRHAYHLFPLRIDPDVWGMSREVLFKAINAEGIPVSAGYTLPLYRQPLFANRDFGPYTGYQRAHADLDYNKTNCPVCERICLHEGGWITQNVLLGSKADVEDVIRVFEKMYEARHELAAAADQIAEKS